MASVWRWVVKLGALGCAVFVISSLAEDVTPWAWAALPLYVWLSLRPTPEPPPAEARPFLPPQSDDNWLAEAHGSRLRGTGISTLAVRYDVDPDWLAAELSRFASTPRTQPAQVRWSA